MIDQFKTKEELLIELAELRGRLNEFEKLSDGKLEPDDALRKAEQEKAIILSSLSELVTYLDKDLKIIWANRAAGESVNMRPEELIGKICYEIWHKRDLPCEDCPVVETLETGQPCQKEITGHKNRVWLVRIYPVRNDDGEVVGVVECTLDVTQNKEAEEALRRSEKRFRMLFDRSNDAVFVHDINEDGLPGGFVEVNEAACSKLGYTKEELLNLSPLDINPHRDLDKVKKFMDALLHDGHILTDAILYSKDGKAIDFEINANVLELGGQKVVLAIGRDTTERKEAQKEIELHKSYFQQLFEDSPSAIVMLDDQDRVILSNNGFRKLFQYTIDEIKGMAINDLIVPENLNGEASGLSSNVLEGEVVHADTSRKRKDGSLVSVSILGYPIVVRDKQIGVYGIYTDISKRKEAEKELKESYEKLHKILDGTVNALASTAEKRDPYTAGHQQRVTKLACAIAKEMGLSPDQIEGIRVTGLLHDIGKIHVAAEILNKPVVLNNIEMRLVKSHAQAGYEILKTVDFAWPVAEIVLQHHERLDGSGYPRGLSEAEILIEAKILAVADVVEAMSSRRPYRPAYSVNEAMDEIRKNRGVLYDPEAVDACLKLFNERKFSFD